MQLKLFIKTFLALITEQTWACMFWIVGLDICYINGKEIYSWYKQTAFAGFINNMCKEKKLIIENSSLAHYNRKKLFFNYCFKANIIAI